MPTQDGILGPAELQQLVAGLDCKTQTDLDHYIAGLPDGALDNLIEAHRIILTNGSPLAAKEIVVRLLIANCINRTQTLLLERHPQLKSDEDHLWLTAPLDHAPAAGEIRSRYNLLRPFLEGEKARAVRQQFNDDLHRTKCFGAAKVIIPSMSEQDQALLAGELDLSCDSQTLEAARLALGRLNSQIEVLRNPDQLERERRNLLEKHPGEAASLTGELAVAVVLPVGPGSSSEDLHQLHQAIKQIQVEVEQTRMREAQEERRVHLQSDYPDAIVFARGRMLAVLMRPVNEQLEYWRSHGHQDPLSKVHQDLEWLECELLTSQQEFAELGETLSAAETCWESLREEYGPLFAAEHAGFKKDLLLHGPAWTLERHPGETPRNLLDQITQILDQKRDQFAKAAERMQSSKGQQPFLSPKSGPSSRQRSAANRKTRGGSTPTKAGPKGPPIGPPNPQGKSQRGGEITTGTKGDRQRRKGGKKK